MNNEAIIPVVWITKYALTQGIFKKVDVCLCDHGMIAVDERMSYKSYYHKGEWHTTEAEALAQAEKMRKAKIASLRKQITKLEAMAFEVK